MRENEDKISVLFVQPGKYPITIRIENSLRRMQELVGGDMEALPLGDGAVLICNEEGRLKELPLNRALVVNPQLKDIIAGNFFIAYAPSDSKEYDSLPPDLEAKYTEKFRNPERFYYGRNGVFVKPFVPEFHQNERENER